MARLEEAFGLARAAGDPLDVARVAEELARGWARRKSAAQSMHYARAATKVAPERKASWTTLAKTCELVATTTPPAKRRRAHALYRAASSAFKHAANLTSDREDKHWLLELAGDAARQAKG